MTQDFTSQLYPNFVKIKFYNLLNEIELLVFNTIEHIIPYNFSKI